MSESGETLKPSSESAAGFGIASPVRGTELLNPKAAILALEEFRALCVKSGEQAQTLEARAKLLRESGYIQELTQALYDVLFDPAANPYVGTLWMRRLVTSKSWHRTYPEELDELCRRGEIGQQAVIELLSYAGTRRKPQLVAAVFRKNKRWLRAHRPGAALMARGLVNTGYYRRAITWLRKVNTGDTTDLDRLFCTVAALRGLGKERQAHRLLSEALPRIQGSPDQSVLLLWFCEEEALSGDPDRAAEAFAQIDTTGWDDNALCLHYLTRGVIRVRRALPERRAAAFKAAYSRIKDVFRKVAPHRRNVLVRRAYRRCVWRMACDSGNRLEGIRSIWRSADTWLTLFPLIIIPGLQLLIPLYVFRCATRRNVFAR
jgi:hypothetical protein